MYRGYSAHDACHGGCRRIPFASCAAYADCMRLSPPSIIRALDFGRRMHGQVGAKAKRSYAKRQTDPLVAVTAAEHRRRFLSPDLARYSLDRIRARRQGQSFQSYANHRCGTPRSKSCPRLISQLVCVRSTKARAQQHNRDARNAFARLTRPASLTFCALSSSAGSFKNDLPRFERLHWAR